MAVVLGILILLLMILLIPVRVSAGASSGEAPPCRSALAFPLDSAVSQAKTEKSGGPSPNPQSRMGRKKSQSGA